MNTSVIGVDLAKSIIHVVGMNKEGRELWKRALKRREVHEFFRNRPRCLVGMEACGSSTYWARELLSLGFEVKLVPAQHVKAYLKRNKNDWNDAAAIAEATSRGSMHFVAVKTEYQQDLQVLHSSRERLIKSRTALCNSIRAMLYERGVTISQGRANLSKKLWLIVDAEREKLSDLIYAHLVELKGELDSLNRKIDNLEKHLIKVSEESPHYRRLLKVDGIGMITASALVAFMPPASEFRNGRHFAAWLGLVPRQHSSGGKSRLLGITKTGNAYLRSLLVQGARVALIWAKTKEDCRNKWAKGVSERRGKQKAWVALANKNARAVWAMFAYDTEFDRSYVNEQYQLAA